MGNCGAKPGAILRMNIPKPIDLHGWVDMSPANRYKCALYLIDTAEEDARSPEGVYKRIAKAWERDVLNPNGITVNTVEIEDGHRELLAVLRQRQALLEQKRALRDAVKVALRVGRSGSKERPYHSDF